MPVPSRAARAPIQRRLLRDEAEAAIREAILAGDFVPGERLDDKALQTWLGISRTPVREALHGLQVQGLVETAAQSYTRVAVPAPEIIGELIETIGVILAGTAYVIVSVVSDDDLSHLVRAIDNVHGAIDRQDAREHLEAAIAFYNILLEKCPNKTLKHYVQTSLVSPSYQFRANIDAWTPRWPMLRLTWRQLERALREQQPGMAEQAIRLMHAHPDLPTSDLL